MSALSPAEQPLGYASNYDKAEQASSGFVATTSKNSLKSATFTTSYTEKEFLTRSSTQASSSTSHPTRAWTRLATSVFSWVTYPWSWYKVQSKDRKQLYSAFRYAKVDEHPEGWPQLAAFLNSDDSFAIFRRFGQTSCRVLLHLQAEIAALEKALADLDRSDAREGSTTSYRLTTSQHKAGWDSAQKDLLKQLQEKLSIYDDLLLKDTQLRALGRPLKRDSRSVFHWITVKKPLALGDDDWILHQEDLAPLASIDHFESSLTCWSKPYLNHLFGSSEQAEKSEDPAVTYFSQKRVSTIAKLISVLLAVAILIIPLFLLFWASLGRGWMSATVLISVLVFSTLMSLLTKTKVQEVLVGTAAYCAVLATFLGNMEPNTLEEIAGIT